MRNANILSPADQYADFRGLPLSQEHLDEIRMREVFVRGGNGEDLRILEHGVGRDLIEVATEISIARFLREEIRGKDAPSTPNGGVVRDMRRRSHGLLIIYPTMAGKREEDAAEHPMVGVAISFPRDDNAQPLEYLVNQVFEQLHLSDPDDPDDAG
jgi:hypothetical protein